MYDSALTEAEACNLGYKPTFMLWLSFSFPVSIDCVYHLDNHEVQDSDMSVGKLQANTFVSSVFYTCCDSDYSNKIFIRYVI